MTRKNLIIAGLLSLTAVGGAAVTAHAMQHGRGPMRADTDRDGFVSRGEFFAAAETRFKARDTNGDRTLAGTEMQDRRGRFARQDTNRDGRLTFGEAAAGTNGRFAQLDQDRDGRLEPGEVGPHGRGRGPGGRMFERADANGDGRITREEMRAQADQRFDRLDANRDGAVDRAELTAMRGPRGRGHGGAGMDAPFPPPPPAPDED